VGRRNRRQEEPQPRAAAGLAGAERREDFGGEEYAVRSVTGQSASKPYRCPGCDQMVGVGVPHVVAWPAHDGDATHRRHWHTACWTARESRRPGIERSRNAPRY
jgi:hypothetical protein